MARMKLEIEGLSEYLNRIQQLDGNIRETTEKALRETHQIVTQKAQKAMSASYLPARGKYSTGETLTHLRRNAAIEWHGDVAEVPVGFNIKGGGLTSIFLMYGTPRMRPDKELYNAFFGSRTRKEVVEAQENVFWNEIRRLEG